MLVEGLVVLKRRFFGSKKPILFIPCDKRFSLTAIMADCEQRLFSIAEDFYMGGKRYLVFNMPNPSSTLEHLIGQEIWPLPRIHVREIALQLVTAVQGQKIYLMNTLCSESLQLSIMKVE